MLIIIGLVIVLVSVLGGYVGNGGDFGVLIQPFEILIIIGAAVGGFIIANPRRVLGASLRSLRSSVSLEGAFGRTSCLV